MKKENIITAVLVGALALAACQRNDDLGDGLRRQVDISATIEGHAQGIRTRAAMNPDGSGTFENGDVLSLFYASTQKPPSDPDFKMPVIMDYTFGSTKLYWEDVKKNSSPTTDNKYGFLAWYPKYAISTEELLEKKGMLDYDVAGAVDDAHRDLLVAKTTDVAYGKPVNLAFHHVMHKLTVNLKSGKYTAGQLAKAQVKLAGFKSHTKVLLGQQRSIVEEASGTGKYPTKEGASVSFIVAPQKLEENLPKLLIEIEGKELTFPMPKTLPGCENNPDNAPTLNSGKHLTLNLSIGSGQGGSDVVTLETGNISAWDDGDSYSGTATEEGGGASAEQFPDPRFKKFVLEKFDTDKDGKISTAEAEAVTEINVPIKEIADLTGIGLFTNLKKLMCHNNKLEKLDVSKCTQLEKLECYNNQLTELNTSGCTLLKDLYCYDNKLEKLDVSGCTLLEELRCYNNQITKLNISGCTQLQDLYCYNNKLTTLNVGATKVLDKLMCGMQKENKQLKLTLGNAHNRDKWKMEWKNDPENKRVTAADEN